jgi:Glycosyl hydrolase family 115/Gylcosyl hydrolase family 115 C-terminal domain/S-layer like family, C-terminal region
MKHSLFPTIILLLATFARASELSISESPTANSFPIVTPLLPTIYTDTHDAKVVQIAANLFSEDIQRVTGRKPIVSQVPPVSSPAESPEILIGTLGSNSLIDSLATTNKLDISKIKNQWEAFTIAVIPNPAPNIPSALVIAGSDRRGTAFGVFTLSQAIGVSPWYWWADVAPAHKSTLYLSLPAPYTDAPTVKYRGIFINDEDWGINPWASKTFDPALGNIGPKTYAKVFELLLRLRLNYIWPAMHGCTTEFGSIPENFQLADDYGIVAGSSHCEPMLCNNVHWKEKTQGLWDYTKNRDAIHTYWETAAKARGPYEAVWTLGIRGIHDAAMEGPKNIPTRVQTVTQVIADQRQLLNQYVTQQFGPIAQCFVPYKEVQPIYDAGLQVPPDVTLVWADDNFGYIRRLSTPQERARPGGAGVYYHISYYGSPHSYTWINTTPPALMWEELHKAWENGAGNLWVVNVGDIKPAEIGISYYAALAWNPQKMGPDSQPIFLKDFAAKTFGDQNAQPIADLLSDYYRLGTIRKPELMNREWALSLSTREAEQLDKAYQNLLTTDDKIIASIPTALHDAYTETVDFPALVLAETGLIFMADRKAQLGEDAGASKSEIATLRARLESQVQNFNTQIAGGKWRYMMPGLETNKDLTKWSSQVRWPWGEKPNDSHPPTAPPALVWHDAADADRQTTSQTASWQIIQGLGQSARAIALEPSNLQTSFADSDPTAPSLQYSFQTTSASDANAYVAFLPTFRIYPGAKLRVAVTIDSQTPELMEVPGATGTEDENGPVRRNAVQDTESRLQIPLTKLSAGKHTLKITAVDPGAVIDRVSLP